MRPVAHFPPRWSPSALLYAALVVCQAAIADDDDRTTPVTLLPKYKTECAACHAAYPPHMLPASSWRRVTSNLRTHYGTDASLDPATTSELSAWLTAHAAADADFRGIPAEDRITRSSWFVRQHGEVPPAAWKRPAIKNASNCVACHTTADQGDFNERNIRIPR